MHGSRDGNTARTFAETMKQTMQQYNCQSNPPRLIEVQGDDRRFENWEKTLKDVLNPQVQCVVLLLAG